MNTLIKEIGKLKIYHSGNIYYFFNEEENLLFEDNDLKLVVDVAVNYMLLDH